MREDSGNAEEIEDGRPLTDLEKFCLDAYIINQDADNAFLISRGKVPKTTPAMLHRQALRWLRRPKVKSYLATRKRILPTLLPPKDNGRLSIEEALALTSKEEMIRELTMTREGLPIGSKERLEANKILIDLQQMKKEIVKEEDKTVHYYLPLSCNQCSLYAQAAQAKAQERARAYSSSS